jgi:hypothetical protein
MENDYKMRGGGYLLTIKLCYGSNEYPISEIRELVLNLLKPTGQVMLHKFKIQQLYILHTLYLCVLYLSENKLRLVPLTA